MCAVVVRPRVTSYAENWTNPATNAGVILAYWLDGLCHVVATLDASDDGRFLDEWRAGTVDDARAAFRAERRRLLVRGYIRSR